MANRGERKATNNLNFRVTDDIDSLLTQLADSLGINKTDVVRMAIKKLAKAEGITPSVPSDTEKGEGVHG